MVEDRTPWGGGDLVRDGENKKCLTLFPSPASVLLGRISNLTLSHAEEPHLDHPQGHRERGPPIRGPLTAPPQGDSLRFNIRGMGVGQQRRRTARDEAAGVRDD
jgi:hypothetical protein